MNTPTLNLRDYIIKHVEDGDTFVFGDLQIDYFEHHNGDDYERLKPYLDKVYKYSKSGDTHYVI
jgi:hypothetical protein